MKREGGPLWNEWGLQGPKPDDSGYLRDLIEYVQDNYAVDAQRIHVVGGSNGAGMTYRMACDHADLIASVMAYAGPMPVDPPPELTECAYTGPVHVLSIHGTSDDSILFDGGCTAPPGFCYASAPDRAETWAEHNGCDLEPDTSCPQLDLEVNIPGDDSTVTKYEFNCSSAGSSHLWATQGGEHLPNVTDEFRYETVEFLLDHPKPGPCPLDLDESNAVDVGDLLQLLSAWGLCDACSEDVTGDGSVNVDDLLMLLASWGVNV
jgi:polyhydroxybutyrate depolymerase